MQFELVPSNRILPTQKRRMWQLTHEGETYNLQTKIGQGYTAEVFKAVSKDKKTVCVKVINDSFLKQQLGKQLIDNQIKILAAMNHRHILKFVKKEKGNKLMIVTEYCEGGTLFEKLQKKGKFDQAECMGIMKQVIEGCSYMHGQGVIHRDLKPQNVFFSDKGSKEIKIADFGFAVNLRDSKLISANVGSPLYMPYEALNDKKFSIQSDVFAIGVIWFELLTGRTPFAATTERQLKEMTKKEQLRKLQLPCNSKIKELILKCLKSKSSERPSLSDLLKGMEEPGGADRTKIKSFYILSMKEEGKGKKEGKQNKDPLFSHQAVNRNQRCQTFVESKQGKTEPLSKMLETQMSKKLMSDTKKSTQQSILPKQSLIKLIKKLSEIKLSFLPISVQEKFTFLLNIYEEIITGQSRKSKKGEQVKQDELMSSLASCKNQQDFCISSFGFLRRLVRLAKAYKEFNLVIEDLSTFWNHIQAQCLIK